MSVDTVRATIYLDPAVHQALRRKAVRTHRSISEIVNAAVQASLQEEDAEDLAAFDQCANEAPIDDEAVIHRIRSRRKPIGSCKVSAETLLDQWRHLPAVDPVQFRADIDSTLDSSL